MQGLNCGGREGTGSRFVTQRPSDPESSDPEGGYPVDPVTVTLFYNELQMSTYM